MVELPGFAVIGKQGQGPSRFGQTWIRPLWSDLADGQEDIIHLLRRGADGEVEGYWGLMSGPRRFLAPWGEEGRYLAGVEAMPGASPPKGWSLWNVPGQIYLVVTCDALSYQTSYEFVMEELFRNPDYQLAGAMHEYYPAGSAAGGVEMYVPIKERE